MPLFDFHCARCDETFEALVKTAAEAECPSCGGQDLERLVAALAPRPRLPNLIKAARKQAGREGHFSNYSRKERSRL